MDSVIRGLRYRTDPVWFEGTKAENRRDAADYFERNRDRMKYDEYLAARLPNWQWSHRGSMSASGQGPAGTYRESLAPFGCTGDAGSASNLLNGEWNAFSKIHTGRRRSTALRQNMRRWVRSTR